VSTAPQIQIVRTAEALRDQLDAWRKSGETIGLVPTMGALHEGHLSLVRRSLAYTTITCASLFVNPTQFGPSEDLDRYPRDEAGDVAKLAELGVDLVFAPSAEEMYGPRSVTQVSVPGLGDTLEGTFRPGFFDGVATIVAKLLILTLPDVAVFGEKDYQQLLVIRRMVEDLRIPTRIEGSRTVRENDGLALSSRNAYLSPDERRQAPRLYQVIGTVATDVAAGAHPEHRAKRAESELLEAGLASVDYVCVRDAETLEPWPGPSRPGRVLAAARLGTTRLIDNIAVPTGIEAQS